MVLVGGAVSQKKKKGDRRKATHERNRCAKLKFTSRIYIKDPQMFRLSHHLLLLLVLLLLLPLLVFFFFILRESLELNTCKGESEALGGREREMNSRT